VQNISELAEIKDIAVKVKQLEYEVSCLKPNAPAQPLRNRLLTWQQTLAQRIPQELLDDANFMTTLDEVVSSSITSAKSAAKDAHKTIEEDNLKRLYSFVNHR